MSPAKEAAPPDAARLSAFDAASLVVGIVIGTTIFKAAGFIAGQTPSPLVLFGLWTLGGVLAFVGALCYAELGAAYGGAGGDYHYLTRAFGPWAGFLFGWTQFVVVQTVNIAMFAYVFAEFAWKLIRPPDPAAAVGQSVISTTPLDLVLTAAATVALLTAVNLIGLQSGKVTQNFLTAAKLVGLALLILAGVFASPSAATTTAEVKTRGDWTVALILILYAYGGWNDAAYIVTHVRNRQRNVPRALLSGVGAITLIYLAVNLAYVHVLGFGGLQHADKPPVALMTGWWGESGGRAMSAIVMVSALGAVNGLILSVSRLHAAVGSDHRAFSILGRWSNRHDAPVGSLIVQAVFTVLLLALVGTPLGRSLLDAIFRVFTGRPLPWSNYESPFDLLYAVGSPVFWTFFLATGVAFFVLRMREPEIERPFRTPFYPIPPLLFCAMCLFGIWASVRYAGLFTWLGVIPVLVGAVVYVVQRFAWQRRIAASGNRD
jgi:amino acid transporter